MLCNSLYFHNVILENQRVICLSVTTETRYDTRDQRESLRGRLTGLKTDNFKDFWEILGNFVFWDGHTVWQLWTSKSWENLDSYTLGDSVVDFCCYLPHFFNILPSRMNPKVRQSHTKTSIGFQLSKKTKAHKAIPWELMFSSFRFTYLSFSLQNWTWDPKSQTLTQIVLFSPTCDEKSI